MKKCFFISLVCFIIPLLSAQESVEPTGFLGIPFGSTMEDAKKTLAKKTDVKLIESNDDSLTYSGQFGGDEAEAIVFVFLKNKLFRGIVGYKTDTNKTFASYRLIKSKFEKKYGTPSKDELTFTSPYYLGDGHEETAIYMNMAKIFCVWDFDEVKISIFCVKEGVMAGYEHKLMLEQYESDQEKQNLEDL